MLLLLTWRHWLQDPETFPRFIGFSTRAGEARWLALATLALFAVNWLTVIWVTAGVDAMGFKSHWGESFDEISFTWPWPAVFIHLLDGIIFAPVLEELLYRGLLFGALRRSMSLYPAAALSGLLFGGGHFYGLAGFLAVSLFGFWCAVAREKTGSLIPPILAHVLTNLILVTSQAAMGLLSR